MTAAAHAGRTRTAPSWPLWWRPWSCRGDLDIDQRDEQVFETDIGAAVLLAQFGERALGHQASRRNDSDPVGHALGDFENMRCHDHGAAGADPLAQQSL